MVSVPAIAGIVRGITRRRGGRGRPKGEIWRQLYSIGNKSLIFIIVTLGFIGMVMTYQACLQLARVTGDFSQIGPQFVRLIVSDFGPTLAALMLATRVGAGIAAEIGSMKGTEQIGARRMRGPAGAQLPVARLAYFTSNVVITGRWSEGATPLEFRTSNTCDPLIVVRVALFDRNT
jgi:ABC-type transporter Mla maintaining outer membrane lipid asymmetry permease subunit MlaE